MKPKLIELTEILKQKPEIKERLESYVWHLECYELLIGYHDVLEYLGEDISLKYLSLEIRKKREYKKGEIHGGDVYNVFEIKLSPGPLSDQTDETLDEIISLCKNVGKV